MRGHGTSRCLPRGCLQMPCLPLVHPCPPVPKQGLGDRTRSRMFTQMKSRDLANRPFSSKKPSHSVLSMGGFLFTWQRQSLQPSVRNLWLFFKCDFFFHAILWSLRYESSSMPLTHFWKSILKKLLQSYRKMLNAQ